jgi:hypothetical protein
MFSSASNNISGLFTNTTSNVTTLFDTLTTNITDTNGGLKTTADAVVSAIGKASSPLAGLSTKIIDVAWAIGEMRVASGEIKKNPITKKAMGGLIRSTYGFGGDVLGSDTVPALLTPGEFVIKRPSVQSFGVDNLKAINNGTYGGESVYNYSINVNVATDASPEQIARAVAQNVRRTESYRLRGNKI